MPGAYAHITVVNHAQKRVRTALRDNDVKFALARHLAYAELGAVSPDYPYLAVGQSEWADHMHYTNTSALLRHGVKYLKELTGDDRARATSWFFGFAAHMASDMTIHPVIEILVGPYAENKSEHRQSEMHQDALIFQKLDLGEVGLTKHLRTGIGSCNHPKSSKKLDPVISSLWLDMLNEAYPPTPATASPKPDKWHSGFVTVLKAISTTNRLFPFARHVATNLNLTYPEPTEINPRFVEKLQTPEGLMSYEQIFDRACTNVLSVWAGLEKALIGQGTTFLDGLQNWNLDTGRAVAGGQYVFWKEGAP